MPEAAAFTIFRVRLLTPDAHVSVPVCARTWPDALTTLQVILLLRGVKTSRRDR